VRAHVWGAMSLGMPRLIACVALFAAAAAVGGGCSSDADNSGETGGNASEPALAEAHQPDPELVETGYQAFAQGQLIQGVLPPDALRHLYISWSDNLGALYQHYTDADGYWEAFNARYGTIPSPFEDATYPAGFGVADDGTIGIDCLLCHAGRLEGKTVIGLSNNRLDLRGLVEDLQRLPAAIAALKMRDLPAPYDGLVQAIPDTTIPEPYASMDVPTAAAGANDGFGLGLLVSKEYGMPPAELRTFMGYQDAPAWWNIRYKERLYSDGSAPSDGVYTMMSTLLAFGLDYAELASYLPTFNAIRHYLCSLDAPKWSQHDLPAIDDALASAGHDVFEQKCATCHGSHDGGTFPNALATPSEIGTDPLRAESFGPVEQDWFNSFIPEPDYEMAASGRYLAPALVGIWASAPYLHNGSVPTLRALLDPAQRPTRWRRSGDTLDAGDVGLSYDTVDQASDRDTIEGRKVVDTTVAGMSNEGHAIPLVVDELDAVLEYLKTL
jgi:mono/diheme cytochrome c family protein